MTFKGKLKIGGDDFAHTMWRRLGYNVICTNGYIGSREDKEKSAMFNECGVLINSSCSISISKIFFIRETTSVISESK